MSKPNSHAIHLDVDAGRTLIDTNADPRAQLDPDRAFSILLLGDFSGGNGAGLTAGLAQRPAVHVDRDNFDEVMSRMKVGLTLRLGTRGNTLSMRFAELADFEPDRIYERHDLFRNLGTQRGQASEDRGEQHATSPAELGALTRGNLLDSIVELSASKQALPQRPRDELQSMVEKIVAPYMTRKEDDPASESALASKENQAILMRAVLHHPDFQALEAAWRAVWMLVRELDTDGQLKLYLLDVSKAELAHESETFRLPSGREQRWAVLAGNYTFDRTDADIGLLAKLGSIARSAGAPFLAESAPPDDADTENRQWQALRRSADARWIGLALPRFILRLPYTADSYAAESFCFDELALHPTHAHYLWGNPAFACAYLLGRSFNQYGWNFRPGRISQIDNLPLHVYTAEGEVFTQPCAEILMTEHQAEYVMAHGLMPLASMKGVDSIRLVRFQSIAEPLAPLSGPWD